MATMIVKHRVNNYEQWKQAFDSMGATRKAHGWKGTLVLRDATDPNIVTIINRVSSVEQAKAYGASPDLKTAMQKGGIAGPPEVQFYEDAEERAV